MSLPLLLKGKRRALFARLVANGALQAGATVSVAWLIQYLFDGFITPSGQTVQASLWMTASGLALAAFALAWLRRTEVIDAERLGQSYIHAIRLALYDAMSHTTIRNLQQRSRGGTLLRFIGDLNSLRRWVSLGLARLVIGSITMTGALLALAMLNSTLALATALVLIIGTGLLISQGIPMRTAVRKARNERARLASNISEKISALAVVQVFGRQKRERKRLARQGNKLKAAMIKQARVSGHMRGIAEITTALASAVVLIVGAREVGLGQATPGAVVAAMGIIALLTPALRDLSRVYEYYQSALVAKQKIEDFLVLPATLQEPAHGRHLGHGPGQLKLANVSLKGALGPISASVEAGQTIAIVGPNGAGKSTLLAAIARLVETDSGAIFLNGQDITDHTVSSLRRAISMLGPDLPLVRGSISKNLRYRCPKATTEELDAIINLCDLDELVDSLPDGLQTRVLEGGRNLSPGQRQRIALGRAIMDNPALLLLDEAEENLDPQSSQVVDRILQQRQGTSLIVTHRADRAAQADIIWHLDAGQIIEMGPASELLHRDGPTQQLFKLHLHQAG